MSNTVKRLSLMAVAAVLLVSGVLLLNKYPHEPILPPVIISADGSQAQLLSTNENDVGRLELMFSHPEHFYDEDIDVQIFASIPGAVIYYTTDGSEPTITSSVYRRPIKLKATNDEREIGVYPLKAIAVNGDNITRPLVHTYFVAKNISERFDSLVVAISTNDEYLYDYDTGIFVEGRTRAEYRAENPRVRIEPPAPANFNWRGLESERPVYVEMFQPDGERIIAQGAGLRVFGGWSRAHNYKSLRLNARRIYEPGEGKFEFDFFPDDVKADGFDTPITEYDQLLLGNQANDRNFSMLRREVNYNLAQQAGLRTVSPSRATAIFLNGEYYGFSWLQVRFNEQYLEDIFSAPTREFQIVGNGETWIETDDEAAREAIYHFNSFYDKDFTDAKVLAEFEKLVDLDNLFLYYAYQTFAGNRDWPDNNMKRWRYTGPQEDEEGNPLKLAPELDGRWRYIVYDLDFLMSLYINDVDANDPAFIHTLTPHNPRYSRMLDALFANPDLADRFALYVCDIASNVITPENVTAQIEMLYEEMYSELGYALDTGKYDHWVSYGSVESNHVNMIKYTQERPKYFLGGMRDYFGWDDAMFEVHVTGSQAVIGTQPGIKATYFAHLTVPLRPNLSRNEVFDHWVINGVVNSNEEITVTAQDAIEGVVNIELVTRIELPKLMIKDAYGSSVKNGIVLHNISDEVHDTKGLYLTNDPTDPYMFAIPAARLDAGGILEFAGRNSNHPDDIHKIGLNFNVREGRVIFLCNEDGEVIDWRHVNCE